MSEKWLSDDELRQILGEEKDTRQKNKKNINDNASEIYYEDLPDEIEVRPIQLEDFDDDNEMEMMKEIPENFQSLFDVSVKITVVLGRKKMSIEEILSLDVDSVIKLDKLAGEPAEIMIDDQVVARGDVVVLDEQFAVEIKEIIHPRERIKTVQRKLWK